MGNCTAFLVSADMYNPLANSRDRRASLGGTGGGSSEPMEFKKSRTCGVWPQYQGGSHCRPRTLCTAFCAFTLQGGRPAGRSGKSLRPLIRNARSTAELLLATFQVQSCRSVVPRTVVCAFSPITSIANHSSCAHTVQSIVANAPFSNLIHPAKVSSPSVGWRKVCMIADASTGVPKNDTSASN